MGGFLRSSEPVRRRLASRGACARAAAAAVLAAVAACAAGAACGGGAAGTVEKGLVLRVVDGDTLKVDLEGRVETVRLIGVDTPETVHPGRPVERFGKEASAFTRRLAEGRLVRLEADPGNADRDRYRRLLRYVFLPDGRLLNAEIIAQGYGHAYTRFPFSRMEEFRALEREAREGERGLWAPPERLGSTGDPQVAGISAAPEAAPGDPERIVYVTATGSKYHAKGCRYLKGAAKAVALGRLPPGLDPCSLCDPPRLAREPR